MHLLVSSLGLKAVTDLGALHGAPVAEILRKLKVSEAALTDPLTRIPWDVFIQVQEEIAEALGGHDAYQKAGHDFLQVVPDFVPVARALLKPKPMMEFVFGVVDRVVYPMVEFDLTDHGDGNFTLRTKVPKSYRPAKVFWAVSAGAVAAMPGYLGLPHAKVTGEWDDHSATYKIRFPKAQRPPSPPPADENGTHPMIGLIRHMGLELVLHLANASQLAERVKQSSAVLEQVVEQMLAEVPHPAFILEASTVRHANEAGHKLLQRNPAVRDELVEAVAQRNVPESSRYSVMSLLEDRYLLVRKGPKGEIDRRVAAAQEHWKLTPRQTEVLRLIVRGSSNKDIAQAIGCAARTVEIHLSKMYEKAGAESRLSLLANFWSAEL